MALTTTRTKGVRKLANGQAPTIRADVDGIVDDIGEAFSKSGPSLPSASADKWPGRSFFHTGERSWYVCDGSAWLPVGGVHSVVLGDFGAPKSGYSYDSAGGASYVYRSGRRIDVRLRIKRNSGALLHGGVGAVFAVAAEYRPAGVGGWPMAALQSGGSALASAVGVMLDASGEIFPLTPDGTSSILELNGSYYIP